MKKKFIIGALSTGLLTTSLIAMPHAGATGESETSIPSQIQSLQTQLEQIKEQVTGLLSTKEDVAALNMQVTEQKTVISEQQTRLDSMSKQIEALKANPTPSASLPEERLAFEGANHKFEINMQELGLSYTSVMPYMVIELFDPKYPEDKLIGITNYKGLVTFTVKSGVKYDIVFKGNDRYRPNVIGVTAGLADRSTNITFGSHAW